MRLLKEQLNHQQEIDEDDENDEDFEGKYVSNGEVNLKARHLPWRLLETEPEPAPPPKRARTVSRRRLEQLEDDESDDDGEHASTATIW